MRGEREGDGEGPSHGTVPAGTAEVAASIVLHPVFLVALVTLVVNDWVLKRTWPSWLTGKLSDAAGLVVCSLLLLAALHVARRPVRRPLAPALEAFPFLVTGLGFAAVQLSGPFSRLYDAATTELMGVVPGMDGIVGSTVRDPGDLLVLPLMVVAFWVGHRCGCPRGDPWPRRLMAQGRKERR